MLTTDLSLSPNKRVLSTSSRGRTTRILKNLWDSNNSRFRSLSSVRLSRALLQISFKTLRHFKGTMEAWRTNSPFHVQEFLRHKNIKNTMRYIHLAQLLFKDEHEYVTQVAHNVKEACTLIEQGWKYQTGEYADGGKIFAKPKDPLASEQ
jgi:integrase